MYCPKCHFEDTKVTDSRLGKSNLSVRRRRQCLRCSHRFSTTEEIQREGMRVIKRDGRREEFSRSKILTGLRKAMEKRPIEAEQMETLVSKVIQTLENRPENEIPTSAIGEEVMKQLKNVDQIAYVRFASVYKDFRDLQELAHEISLL